MHAAVVINNTAQHMYSHVPESVKTTAAAVA